MKNNKASVTQILAVEAAKVIAGEQNGPRFDTGNAFRPAPEAPAGAPDKATALTNLTATLKTFVAAGQSFGDALRIAIESGATRAELTAAFTAAGVKRGTLNQALARGMAQGQWLHLRMRVRSDSDDKAIQAMAEWAGDYLNDPVKARSTPANKGDKTGDNKTGEGKGDTNTPPDGDTVKLTPREVGTAWLRDLTPEDFVVALVDAKGGVKGAKAFLGKVAETWVKAGGPVGPNK